VRAQRAAQAAEAAQAAQRAQAATAEDRIPPALRGKGIAGPQQGQQPLTYSGPAEGGGVESRSNGQNAGDDSGGGGAAGSGTRRERRAAARDAQKKGKKGPRR
jgi:preprotein translocase subunit SecA